MLEWLKSHPGPVYTSRAHPDYPGLVDYPLADVMNACGGLAYFNGTCAYAVAFALFLGVKKLTLFGCDFSYANSHQAEQGRGCVEFYLGMFRARGGLIGLPNTTSLLDAVATNGQRLYGYDTVNVAIDHDADDKITLNSRRAKRFRPLRKSNTATTTRNRLRRMCGRSSAQAGHPHRSR
jgi:hypothetical protein